MTNIPTHYKDASIENLAPDVKVSIEKWIEQRSEGKKSLMLFGGYGVGKTYVMYAMINWKPNVRVRFYNSSALIEDIKASYNDAYAQNPVISLRDYEGYLFLDDFGSERVTDFVQDQFYQIINDRYVNNLPVVISTNYELGELADRLGERIASRLAQMCFIINITGDDRRLKS